VEEEEKRELKLGPTKGADLRNDVEITFEDAYRNGAKPGSKVDTCTTCRRNSDKSDKFNLHYLDKCKPLKPVQPAGGTGKIIKEPCEKCRGKGRIRKQTKISVTIPAGIDDRSNRCFKK